MTPMPFFIRFADTRASMDWTGSPSSRAAVAAAKASDTGSVHPVAGTTSVFMISIILSHFAFVILSCAPFYENAKNGEITNKMPVKMMIFRLRSLN